MQEFKKFQNEPKSKFGKSELDVYLEEKTFNYDDYYDLDALGHWKTSKNIFLTLATIIRDILSIPITIVATKSTFDIGGCVLTKYWSSTLPETNKMLICIRNWLHGFEEFPNCNNLLLYLLLVYYLKIYCLIFSQFI